jgi:hypothetical protein
MLKESERTVGERSMEDPRIRARGGGYEYARASEIRALASVRQQTVR